MFYPALCAGVLNCEMEPLSMLLVWAPDRYSVFGNGMISRPLDGWSILVVEDEPIIAMDICETSRRGRSEDRGSRI